MADIPSISTQAAKIAGYEKVIDLKQILLNPEYRQLNDFALEVGNSFGLNSSLRFSSSIHGFAQDLTNQPNKNRLEAVFTTKINSTESAYAIDGKIKDRSSTPGEDTDSYGRIRIILNEKDGNLTAKEVQISPFASFDNHRSGIFGYFTIKNGMSPQFLNNFAALMEATKEELAPFYVNGNSLRSRAADSSRPQIDFVVVVPDGRMVRCMETENHSLLVFEASRNAKGQSVVKQKDTKVQLPQDGQNNLMSFPLPSGGHLEIKMVSHARQPSETLRTTTNYPEHVIMRANDIFPESRTAATLVDKVGKKYQAHVLGAVHSELVKRLPN